ncbi:MAG: T9SS type A sorting domain-containing protein [Ferruginibacter sp.]|nr:T9SS type A sorting domain-containing protein [Ferruginibacter sp.]
MKNIYLLIFALIGILPASFSQVNSTASGGNWSDPGTWAGGTVPVNTDDVIVVDGAMVTLDVDATIVSLTVGQGVSGILEFEAITARTLTVTADVTINTGGIFRSSVSGTQTTHVLSANGNITNNGSLNFSTNGNTAGAAIIFTGAANNSFSGTGITTDVSAITIDKGTSEASVLELAVDNFSFQGSTSTPGVVQSFLTLVNGTFKISGTFTMDNAVFTGTGAYTIPETAGLWLNNPNFTVNARAGTANVDGTLQVDAGTMNIGTAVNNRLGYIAGTVITINGGVVNVASRFSATTTFGIIYTQTGGILNVNTVGSTSVTRASFDIRNNDNSLFAMSGGLIVLQNPGISGSGPRDYFNDASIINITGGTLQVGNALTTGAQTFFLAGKAPAIVIDNATGGHTVQLFDNLSVFGNTTVNSGTTLNLDDQVAGHNFIQIGSTITNGGTLNGTAASSLLSFSGTAAQTYGGDGVLTSPVANLELNNAAGLSITNTVATDITANQFFMLSGDIITGVSTVAVGTGTAALGIFNYTSGTIVGKFKRWIAASTGNTDFPVGIVGATRTASIDFTQAPTIGGTLTAQWQSLYPGANGLPLTEPGYPVLDSTASDGYWTVIAADGLTDGIYTGTFTGTNITTVIDFTQVVLVKRADASSPWTLDGTHVPSTGSNTSPILSRTGMIGFSDFAIAGTGNVSILPITVQYFKGSKLASGNLLDWKVTCTNTPSATMVLERSNDARKFSAINSVTATALRCLQPFSYIDAAPNAGINYYRIKLIDADGKFAYSDIIALLNKEKGFDIVSMVPNPVQDITVLNIASAVATKMSIVVTDAAGKRVAIRTISLVAGSNKVQLDFSNLSAGNYQVTGYTSGAEKKTLRFIKN